MVKTMRWMVMGLLVLPWSAFAQTPADDDANQFYQSAMQSYLAGDLDKAILLDSKALTVKPNFKKASDFLNTLVTEKEEADRTVIWIGEGNSPAVVPMVPKPILAPPPVAPQNAQIGLPVRRVPGVTQKKFDELEKRIQVVATLLGRNSDDQYKELRMGLVDTANELKALREETQKNLDRNERSQGIQDLLLLLVLLIASLALWESLGTRREQKKFQALAGRTLTPEEKSKVVGIHRY